MDETIQDVAFESNHLQAPSQPTYGSKSYDPIMSSMSMAHAGSQNELSSSAGASALPAHLSQPMDTLSQFMSIEDDLMSEGSQLASGEGMYAGSDSGVNDLDQLEPLPTVEYGFGGGYVDMPFDDPGNAMSLGNNRGNGSLSSSSNGAHLGIGGLAHQQMPAMVVNHHYYQPTWDHSQSYFLGATHQPPMDPYFAAYPTSAPSMMQHQAPGQQTSGQGYHASNGENTQYYPEYSQYQPGTSSNARPSNYYQYK